METHALSWVSFGTLGLACLAGCATESKPEVTTTECPQALVASQGVTVQGLSVQGLTAQGVTAQGITAQGITAQGITAQGFAFNGMNINGFNYNGVTAQGVNFQGLSPQGITPQGVTAQGITAQGITAQGHGLSGLALRGVSEDEASRWVEGQGSLDSEQVVFINLERTVLTGRTAAGEALEGEALVGLLLPFSSDKGTLWIAITGVSHHPSADDLAMYSLAVGGQSLCADAEGGMFVPGIWDATGARHDRVAAGAGSIDTTFSCTAGVIAKCVAWGYRPWDVGADLHAACTRMARADYCGDGVPHTENGTLIDMYDTHDIQTPVDVEGLSFEAGWSKDGAVCVSSPRYVDQTADGVPILPTCWSDKPHCESFDEAVSLGAELGNDSGHTPRSFECGY